MGRWRFQEERSCRVSGDCGPESTSWRSSGGCGAGGEDAAGGGKEPDGRTGTVHEKSSLAGLDGRREDGIEFPLIEATPRRCRSRTRASTQSSAKRDFKFATTHKTEAGVREAPAQRRPCSRSRCWDDGVRRLFGTTTARRRRTSAKQLLRESRLSRMRTASIQPPYGGEGSGLFRANGLIVEDLIELVPHRTQRHAYGPVANRMARRHAAETSGRRARPKPLYRSRL